ARRARARTRGATRRDAHARRDQAGVRVRRLGRHLRAPHSRARVARRRAPQARGLRDRANVGRSGRARRSRFRGRPDPAFPRARRSAARGPREQGGGLMRFGLVHRVMTDALAVLGILAVVSTSTLSPWATALLLVGLAGALAVPESWQTKALFRHAATTGMLLLFVVQGARIVAGQPVIDVMVEFAALLQIIRLATRRGAAHDQQIIVLSLLHFVAGTVLGGGLAYGLCFLGFLVVAPGALVLSHLRREVEGNYRQGARDRTG